MSCSRPRKPVVVSRATLRSVRLIRRPDIGHHDGGDEPSAPAFGRAILEGRSQCLAQLLDDLRELFIGEPQGNLAIADAVCLEVGRRFIEVRAERFDERAEKGREVSEMIFVGRVLVILRAERNGLGNDAIGALNPTPHRLLLDHLEEATVVQLVHMSVERGLWHVAQGLLQAQRRHRAPDQRLNDAEPDGVKQQISSFSHEVDSILSFLIIFSFTIMNTHSLNGQRMNAIPLTFQSGGYTLAGTLTLPANGAQVAGALLVSGSGPIDRDSNMKRARIDVMRQVAGHLAVQGIASLRYDKRGIGESEGDYKATGLFDNVDDARAAVAALGDRPEIDADSVFAVGHSEGALIATELADDASLAGAVLLAGTAQSGKAVLRWQAQQLAKSLPTPVKLIMKLLRQDLMTTQEKRFAQLEATTTDVARIQMIRVNARWFREFMAHDPADSLKNIAVPVLAITGSKDIQSDPADIARMEELIPTEFEGHVLSGVTHLLRSDDGPASSRTYKKQMKRPVDVGLLDLVSSWIDSRSRRLREVTRGR